MTSNKGVKQIDAPVAEKWEGDVRTGGSFGGSNYPIAKWPGLLTHGDQPWSWAIHYDLWRIKERQNLGHPALTSHLKKLKKMSLAFARAFLLTQLGGSGRKEAVESTDSDAPGWGLNLLNSMFYMS